ncbi:Protein tyrosine/serine phosphatase [Piscirickettsia salmonis]|nr:Protein tyrosine/serine phosphatase [Piscirickettsia salmonis]
MIKLFYIKKRVIFYPLFVILIFIICFILYYGYNLYLNNNFHVVIPGQIYRSAQPTPNDLNKYMKQYHIKSIINLRGQQIGSDWYDNEVSFAKMYHINHFNVALDAHKVPSLNTLHYLIYLIENAPRPLLFHCRAGADRTGLASALSIILNGNSSLDDLEEQASWQYAALSPTTIGYQVLKNYLDWLSENHKTNSKANFLVWDRSLKELKSYKGWFFT